MQALRAVAHVTVGLAGAVVPLVVLARAWQGGEVVMDRVGPRRLGSQRQRRRSAEGGAHQGDGAKHVRADEGAEGRHRRAEVVTDDRVHMAAAERGHQTQSIAHDVEQTEAREVSVVSFVPAGGKAVAALVRRHHVIAGIGQGRHHFAPGVGQLGKAVQEQQTGPRGIVVAGFQDV